VQAFDYLFQLIAILVGLALADLCLSFHRLLRARSRVRWHWFPLAAAALVVLLTLDLWWGLRPLARADVTMTVGMFLPLLAGLIVFFLLAAAALPDEVPADGVDLRAHYFGEQRYFWSLFAALIALFCLSRIGIAVAIAGWDVLPKLAADLVPNFVLVALAVSLALVRRAWYHSVGLILLLLAMLASWFQRPLV
jgi:hypothetical protein